MAGLSERQRRFCEEYLVDYSPVKAMIRAGYAFKTANRNSGEFMKNPFIQEYLGKRARKQSEKIALTAERVLEEISRLAFSNIADFYKQDPKTKKFVLKDISELTPAQQACIAEYSPGKPIKLYNKDSALDKLGKHFKLYTDIDAVVHNLVVMPSLRISGKEVVFEVGKPAPKIQPNKTN
jgi:phage terminase small subunit